MARPSGTLGVTRDWLGIRAFPSESERDRAQRLRTVAIGILVAYAIQMTAMAAVAPPTWSRRLAALAIVAVIVGVVYLINGRGRTDLASWVLVLGLVAMVTQRSWSAGGIGSLAMAQYVLFVLMGGVLLGQLGGLVTAAACTVGGSILVVAGLLGWLPSYPSPSPVAMLVFMVPIFGIGLVLQAMVGNTFRATLQRQDEEIARRTQTQLRLDMALSAGKIAVWELDQARGQLLTDERMGEFYGVQVAPDGVVPLEAVVAHIHPDDRASVMARGDGIRRAGATVEHEHRVVRRDGSLLYVRGASVMVPGAEGQGDRVVGVTMDVTELQRSRRELEDLVERRTAELRSARDAAEQAGRAKGTFLANMSHEIRTPMNAILGYEQLLQADTNLTEGQRRKLDVIRTSGDHLLSLINDILDMSRIEAGHATLSVEPFDLHARLADVRSMFATQTAKRGISLDVYVDASVPRGISADAGKVRQVLINLIGNAVKFTDAGGVHVRVRAARAGDTRCMVTVDVEDTGPGIDAAEFEMIFSPFGQAKGGAARGGTGLGLPISRSFARLMDGDITVKSTRGHGSTFTFTFVGTVLEDGIVAPERRRSAPHRLAAGETRRKVLVVDDVPTNRELLAETLTRAGFEIRAVASGEEALDVYAAWTPDLVVTDVHMPGIGGLEAIRQLRARGSRTPVVVTTASTDEATADRVREAGAQQLLRKPHRERELLEVISRLLGVELVAVAAAAANAGPIAPLGSLVHEIPAPLVTALVEAASTARAARILELAAEIERHSPAAAEGIRHLADSFRYAALLEALGGNGSHGA